MSSSSIWPIDGTLSGATTPALLEPHHQIVEGHIYNTHGEGSYTFVEMQSVYSTAPDDWAIWSYSFESIAKCLNIFFLSLEVEKIFL